MSLAADAFVSQMAGNVLTLPSASVIVYLASFSHLADVANVCPRWLTVCVWRPF